MSVSVLERVAGRGAGRAWRLIAIAMLVATVAVFRRPIFQGNFGTVDAGRVYRSAQPRNDLRALIRRYGLKSVLNLRGGTEYDDWYCAEVRTLSREQVEFYDLPMSATQRPTRRVLLKVLDVLERCRYPLLIHCKSGSDRTGLVSGLYLLQECGRSPREALGAFSLGFGHVPLGGTERLHAPFSEYDAWLKAEGLTHTPARFREWVARVYRDDSDQRPAAPSRGSSPSTFAAVPAS